MTSRRDFMRTLLGAGAVIGAPALLAEQPNTDLVPCEPVKSVSGVHIRTVAGTSALPGNSSVAKFYDAKLGEPFQVVNPSRPKLITDFCDRAPHYGATTADRTTRLQIGDWDMHCVSRIDITPMPDAIPGHKNAMWATVDLFVNPAGAGKGWTVPLRLTAADFLSRPHLMLADGVPVGLKVDKVETIHYDRDDLMRIARVTASGLIDLEISQPDVDVLFYECDGCSRTKIAGRHAQSSGVIELLMPHVSPDGASCYQLTYVDGEHRDLGPAICLMCSSRVFRKYTYRLHQFSRLQLVAGAGDNSAIAFDQPKPSGDIFAKANENWTVCHRHTLPTMLPIWPY